MASRARLVTALLLGVMLTACGGNARYPGEHRANQATIVINNASSSHSSLTVHLITPMGQRQRLGTVNLNETRKFTYRNANLSGTYQLFAEPLGARDFASHAFTLTAGDVVEWDLRLNSVLYQGTATRE